MRIIRRTIGAQTVTSGIDRVIGNAPLPKGGKVLSVHGELHVIGEESMPVDEFSAYGFSAHVVPIVDPETSIGLGALWDDVVVKALDPTTTAATSVLDMDWATDDTSPEIEPGELDVDDLLNMTQGQKELIAPRLEWISWAKSRQGGWVAATPDTYVGSDYKTFSSKRKITAEVPSMALIGFSSPSLDDRMIQSADVTMGSAAEWYMAQNMNETLRDMGKMQAGLTEAGAESPYAEASSLIADLVAPSMLDESTTMYRSCAYDVLCVATWLLEFPGESLPRTLDGR